MDKILDSIIKIAKETKGLQVTILITIIPFLIISYSKYLQSLLSIPISSSFRLAISIIFIFLITWLFLNRKKSEVGLDPKKVREEYDSDEMRKRKIKLTEWLRENSLDKFEEQIRLSEGNRDPSFKGIDESRESISKCFTHIKQAMSKKEIKSFVAMSDVGLLLDDIWPMEVRIGKKMNRRPCEKKFKFFKKIYKKELEHYRQTIQEI